MQKIAPFLWFDGKAEEAMTFYVSIFKNAKVVGVSRYGDEGPGPAGSVMVGTFELEGQKFHALNGGPEFTFTPAISFLVNCETQPEVDEFWEKLSAGGKTLLMQDEDEKKSANVMKAMLQMEKFDIQKLQDAYDQA